MVSSGRAQMRLNLVIDLNLSVEYSLHLTKILILKIRKDHQKNSYERRGYESVDVRILFCVISHRSTETSTPGLEGLMTWYWLSVRYIMPFGLFYIRSNSFSYDKNWSEKIQLQCTPSPPNNYCFHTHLFHYSLFNMKFLTISNQIVDKTH